MYKRYVLFRIALFWECSFGNDLWFRVRNWLGTLKWFDNNISWDYGTLELVFQACHVQLIVSGRHAALDCLMESNIASPLPLGKFEFSCTQLDS